MAALDFTDKTVLQECLQWIKEVAKQAGGIVTEGFLSEVIAVDVKTAFYDLVTEYDTRTEEYLIKAILDKYPDHKWVLEGSPVSNLCNQPTSVFTGSLERNLMQLLEWMTF